MKWKFAGKGFEEKGVATAGLGQTGKGDSLDPSTLYSLGSGCHIKD